MLPLVSKWNPCILTLNVHCGGGGVNLLSVLCNSPSDFFTLDVMSLQVLQTQLECLQQSHDDMQSSCEFTQQALQQGGGTEALLVRKQMSERLSALADSSLNLFPQENDHLEFRADPEALRRSILNLGSLVTTHAVACHTVATGDALRQVLNLLYIFPSKFYDFLLIAFSHIT